MDSIKLNASKREISGKQVKQLRTKGLVPAVVYGHGVESRNVAVDYRQMEKALNDAGESTLIDLNVDGEAPVKVLIHEVQYEPLIGSLTHVDFRQVKMDEKITTEIPIRFVGEAPAVKNLGGTLVRNIETLTVSCLPGDLVHEFEVSLDNLANIDDNITVADIKPPKGVEIEDEPEQIIAIVTGVVSEEELAQMEAESGDVSQVKVAGEEKKAEEAAAAESKQ
jgi:large subunit ribosomal protein L25